MRTRKRDERYGPRYPLVRTDDNTGSGSSSCMNFSSAFLGSVSQMDDHNNGSQFTRGFVMSPCKLVKISREAKENPKVECTALNSNGSTARRTFSGDFAGYVSYGFPNSLQVDMGNAKALALIEAYAKMNSSPTLGGEQLATMKETIGMIRSPFQSATKLAKRFWRDLGKRKRLIHRNYTRDIRKLKKLKLPKSEYAKRAARFAEDMAKATADVRLEFRYGVMPLLLDCESHIEYIAEKLRGEQGHSEMRVARSRKYSAAKAENYTGAVGIGLDKVYEPTASMTRSVTSTVSAGVAYRVTATSNIEQLTAHLGLRLRDVPITAYALIPLSFVADWAVNVEEWLQAILPVPNIQPLGNWVTTVERRSMVVNSVDFYTILGWGTNRMVRASFPGSNEESLTYTRDVDNSLSSHPLLIGKPLSNTHLGDAAALSVNKFIGMVKRLL